MLEKWNHESVGYFHIPDSLGETYHFFNIKYITSDIGHIWIFMDELFVFLPV